MGNARLGFEMMPKVVLSVIVGTIAFMYFFGFDDAFEAVRNYYINAQRWISGWTPL